MLWIVGLVSLLPLAFYLADSDWSADATEDAVVDADGPDLLADVMAGGTEAEPVWGAWVRVKDFDPETDLLMIDADGGADVHVTSSASAEGNTYLMLSDGTRIVLERVAELPCAPEEIMFFLQG